MYTDEETKKLEKYDGTRESVKSLATEIGKSERSVIAKLAKMGLYKTAPRTTKTGDPIISKNELVASISEMVELELETLVKAGKEDLRKLEARLKEMLE